MSSYRINSAKAVFCSEKNISNLNISLSHPDAEATQELHFTYTHHASYRSSKRNISPKLIAAVLAFGEVYQKQGYEYHILGKKELDIFGLSFQLDDTLVVVMKNDIIITAYYANNGFKHIKRKQKNLATTLL